MGKEKRSSRLMEILAVSTKLGLTSFGGPVAHLGYFRQEYVQKRKWLDERSYADLIALCQFLPGPASSQVGMAIGMLRGGILGGIMSWIGFTLPSVLLLLLFAYAFVEFQMGGAGWIHGLKLVAVAVVAQAVLGMGTKLAPDRPRITIAVAAAVMTLLWPTAFGQIGLIVIAAIVGLAIYKRGDVPEIDEHTNIPIRKRTGVIAWLLFVGLLVMLPVVRQLISNGWIAVFDTFYRVGSLVFGGGHVVLPMLEREVVPVGWVTEEAFLAGYGAAQAVPGPLFTFAGYLGGIMNGWLGALVTTLAIFLPSFLLIIGSLPFWDIVRRRPRVQAALYGVNAAVVGILLAALYDPVFTSAVTSSLDFIGVLVAFTLLVYWKLPPWLVVIMAAVVGAFLF